MNSKTKSIIYVLICVLLWSLIPVVSKLGQSNLDSHQFLFWSSIASFLTFVVIIITRKKGNMILKLSKKDWVYSISLGFLGTYLYYILLYFGYVNGKGIEVLVIQYCWPIFVIILSVLILKEKINGRKIIAITLGFLGVFVVLTKGELNDLYFEIVMVSTK
ncbi:MULTISPECIES: DMT family transporter [Aquimarina]|uniref:DMT family transporter n=1 Tax=Aquimarina TaxID=290174 RepID=UPI000944871D|nr:MULTISPECIES: DMT family transporter [Aquimarina]